MEKVALLSVYSKEGIVEFARELVSRGWQLLASSGTTKAIAGAGLPVRDVAELVGGGPILGHRVVTLSREVHAGLLSRDIDIAELEALGIPHIDLACIDFYPLGMEMTRPGSTLESVTEQTDIGGPTLLRSAAKGRRLVIGDPADRAMVLQWLRDGTANDPAKLRWLAAKAEFIVARYALLSASYLGEGEFAGLIGRRVHSCLYGENPYQGNAALYSLDTNDPLALERFELVEGEKPSYNNWVDLHRVLAVGAHLAAAQQLNLTTVQPFVIGVKHGNPCGATASQSEVLAVDLMVQGSRQAIMGGTVLTNRPVNDRSAHHLVWVGRPAGERRLIDVIAAPTFTDGAREILRRKHGKCRMLGNPALEHLGGPGTIDTAPLARPVRGGFLSQDNYTFVLDLRHPELRWYGTPTDDDRNGLILAWAVGAFSNSNTVTVVSGKGPSYLIGNGVGQQDRVTAAKLAIQRVREAGHDSKGAVAYSDSFFPFPDGAQVLVDAGIRAVLTSSGSVNDAAVIKTFQDAGVVLGMFPDKLGRGFYGH
ncbi:MAG: phosphoribosylaminoimidazolecarboxamide formyltransferase / IMP cyclohydrolase [Parcubacteria group bacterium Gr01-1014_31]|nr:MAG: phosphoribosylaminoimidazolecarboxamide formyltransferase / IMP cyclohydrolase [Parcubacteria group bacterium Gr01-1014_31]